jgi:predicted helicase
LTEIFAFQSVSGKPGDDGLLISFSEAEVIPKLRAFRSALGHSDLKLTEAGRKLAALPPKSAFSSRHIVPYAYRPFDTRYTYYDPAIWTRAVERLRSCVNGSPILLTTKIVKDASFSHVFVTRSFADVIFLSNTSSVNCYSFPQKYADGSPSLHTESAMAENLNTTLFQTVLGKSVSADTALRYIYAILHSPSYRQRYREPLQLDFPRIPLTKNLRLFEAMVGLGGELIAVHLLESQRLHRPAATYVGSPSTEIEKVTYAKGAVWVNTLQTCGFRGVSEPVWSFHIGGYQVCEKWLKDRRGRALSKDDIEHYQRVIEAISETIRLMTEVDTVVDHHGGWPAAFLST